MSSNDKIEVEWLDTGRSQGKRSWIKRTNVKKGDIMVGRTVNAIWGKSKRLYTCKVTKIDASSPEIPMQEEVSRVRNKRKRSREDEPFLLEIGSPAPHPQPEKPNSTFPLEKTVEIPIIAAGSSSSEQSSVAVDSTSKRLDEIVQMIRESGLSDFKERFEDLIDCISGINAKIRALELSIRSSYHQEPAPNEYVPGTGPLSSTLQPEAETMILHEIENLLPSATTSVLQDVGNLPNNSRDTGIQKFTISYVIIDRAMSGCRSRRNLAARLTQALFTDEEKKSSNVRGVGGKQSLNEAKVDAIRESCYKQFPLDRVESKVNADREIRHAMDEVCRKIRAKQPLQ